MAGTIPLSMTQQFNEYGEPLSGGQLYIITAGTVSTPQDAFQDTALTIKQPYPMTLDAAGRVPAFYLADGTVKIRLQDRNGVVQLAADQVLVIGPSSGGGGGGAAVDPTQLIQTGNMIFRYGVGTLAGYVRCNGLTIGSTTSGATMPEGARPECQALFQHLWNADPNLVVTPGPRTTASGDWGANKTIATPDWRGVVPCGLADMGNSPTTVMTTGYYGSDPTKLGGLGGSQSQTLITGNLPPYTPSGLITNGAIRSSVSPAVNNILSSTGFVQVGGGGSFFSYNLNSLTISSPQDPSSFTGDAQGGISTPISMVQPSRLCTFYIKL